MKEFVLFFLICLKVCLCWHFSRQDSKFNYAASITQNPWAVMIIRPGPVVVSYGALFHERAVITTSAIERYNIFQLQVFADCHTLDSLQTIDNTICKDVRNIIEYDVLKASPTLISLFDLAVLILSRPFELTPTLNVIHFGHQSNLQLDKCTILYPTLVTNPITNETGALFYPSFNIRWPEFETELLNRFKNIKRGEAAWVLPGSPLLCRSKTKTDKWHAIATMAEAFITSPQSSGSSLLPIEFKDKSVEIFTEILKNFQVSRNPSELILYDD